jgi:hypothetical protein
MIRPYRVFALFALCAFVPSALLAAPFASNVVISGGTNVSFILNESAPYLAYTINGGSPTLLDGSTKGTKNFSLGSATDTFAILVAKSDPVGYTIPTGGTLPVAPNGLSQVTNESGLNLLSNDADNLVKFNSPRGVSVNNNPNASNFGTSYISNSAAGATGGRTLTGDGVYAIRADQSDAFGYADAAQGTSVFGAAASANTPYKLMVASNGEVYVTGFGDGVSGVFRMPANLSVVDTVLAGTTGPTTLPVGQNHGSVAATYVEGSSAGGDLTVWTMDEDMTNAQLTRTLPSDPMGTDTNKLWRYDINGASLPYSAMPTAVTSPNTPLVAGASVVIDVDRGADGKFYLSQNRSAGNEAGIFVLDSSGAVLYDSLTASRALLGNPTAADIIRNVFAIAVSPDQQWLAVMLNASDVAVVPLVGGIPDLANRLIVNSANPDIISGRDIAFDAANNIHYVSSGQGRYRVLSPGGQTMATTSWDGSSFSFSITIPEPTSLVLLSMLLSGFCLARRRVF